MAHHVFALTIGAMAKAAGVSTPTIRFYESIGLLPQPIRSAARQRVYSAADLDRLIFVRRCRDFGSGIEAVRSLLGMSVSAEPDCASPREVVAAHLTDLRQRLAEMQALEVQLAGFVTRCDEGCAPGGPARDCAIFADLGGAQSGCN